MPTTEELLAIIDLQVEVAELGLDLSGVMDLVVRRVLDLAHAEGAAIELAEEAVMVYRAVAGRALTQLGLRVDVARSLSGLCIATGTSLVCEDSETDTRVDQAACRRVGLRSMIVVPLMHHGRCVGVLKALSSRPQAFTQEQLTLLSLLSRVVGTAMYWATRYGESDLFHRATHDALTGLANRALFMDRLRAALAARQRQGGAVVLVLLDMDGLKQINDRHGHAAGDAALMELGARLRQITRASDTVARLGGDEFAIVLPQARGEDDGASWSQRLAQALAPPLHLAGLSLPLSASWGCAVCPPEGGSIEALMALADQRMYAAKRARKSPGMDAAEGGLYI
ncbi:sensor domain-containing diguanylate cyclase [Ideonella sp. B7]|uniref:sensor domain-containing diguanylate cyclase n=1 Tax=Ideonella benzenivorans TaxID=2831643 RepID=UPI001CED22EA|nr:sensor domain-containing diguanylate cyclase [Ideonella benzenivorans]MCA6215935.1 sensor domain-containing diguanylate cyclase [Ideonella benzenivorans]